MDDCLLDESLFNLKGQDIITSGQESNPSETRMSFMARGWIPGRSGIGPTVKKTKKTNLFLHFGLVNILGISF
jgi:hypothetical protein